MHASYVVYLLLCFIRPDPSDKGFSKEYCSRDDGTLQRRGERRLNFGRFVPFGQYIDGRRAEECAESW